MQVIFDNIIFSLQKSGGGSLYWSELIKNMSSKIFAFLNSAQAKNNYFYPSSNIENFTVDERPVMVSRYLPVHRKATVPFIFHSSYYRYCNSHNAINITTVHDFVYEKYRKDLFSLIHKIQKRSAVMHSSGVICISVNTYKDFKSLYPKYSGEITVINNGISKDYYVIKETKKTKKVIFIGSRAHYKNFFYSVHLLSKIEGLEFVIIGGGELNRKEKKFLDVNLPGRYTKLSNITNSELNKLYNESFFLLYPSLYEGFGIPVVEAQAAGCPVVCCFRSSIPEVAGNAAVFINGQDLLSDVKSIQTLFDSKIYTALIERGLNNSKRFSWEKCAQDTYEFYIKVYQKVISE